MPVNPRKKVSLAKQELEEVLDQDNISQEEESQESETIASYQDENNEDELIKEKEEVLKKITIDFSRKEMAKAKATQKLIPNAGVLTMINSENNGKRITFNREVQQLLNHPNTIQVGFLDNYLLLGEHLDPEATSYNLKKQGAKAVLYNKALVEEIIERFNIKYTENKVSKTFYEAKCTNDEEGNPIVVVKVK